MPFFVPALISGISALAGGLLNRKKELTQQGTSNTTNNFNQTSNVDTTSTPTYDPMQLAMRNQLLNQFSQRTQPGAVEGLVNSTISQGVNNINSGAQAQEQALRANLAQRGLSYSGTAGNAMAQQQSQRVGDVVGLRSQAPLLQNQFESQRLNDFSSFMKGLPTGTHTTGVNTSSGTGTSQGTTSGTTTDPGNPWGGMIGNLATSLSGLYGVGAFQDGENKNKKIAGIPGGHG